MTNEAITFDDVLLVPSYNKYESRKMVDISNQDKTGKLKLKLPVISANMDTITGSGRKRNENILITESCNVAFKVIRSRLRGNEGFTVRESDRLVFR